MTLLINNVEINEPQKVLLIDFIISSQLIFKLLSASPTKWLNTLKQFFYFCRRIV